MKPGPSSSDPRAPRRPRRSPGPRLPLALATLVLGPAAGVLAPAALRAAPPQTAPPTAAPGPDPARTDPDPPAAAPAEAEARLAPRLAILAAQAAPVLGVDFETDLHLVVEGPPPPPDALPRVRCNVGRIEDVARTGPRTFTARYVFPAERFPQVALIAADLPGGLRGTGVVRLRAPASPRFRTDPGAAVTYVVAGKEFGPQRAGPDGLVRIPIVVPPGVSVGLARSVNEFGKVTEQTFELTPPPYPRVVALAPDAIAAGHPAEVAVYAVEPTGVPTDSTDIVMTTSNGRAHPLGGGPGENRFLVRAPARVDAAKLTLTAAIDGQSGSELSLGIPVVPGAPARLRLQSDRGRLPVGTDVSARVRVVAEDLFGNRTDASGVEILVDGTPLGLRQTAEGDLEARVPAPPREDGRDHLEFEAILRGRHTRERLALVARPAPPAPPPPRRLADPALSLGLRAGLLWNAPQTPGPAATVELLAHRPRWAPGLDLGGAVGLARYAFAAGDRRGITDVTLVQVPALLTARVQGRPARRLELSGGMGAGATLVHADMAMGPLVSRAYALGPAVEGAVTAAVRTETGAFLAGVRYLWTRPGRLSSSDRLIGNSAGLWLDLGFRFGLRDKEPR